MWVLQLARRSSGVLLDGRIRDQPGDEKVRVVGGVEGEPLVDLLLLVFWQFAPMRLILNTLFLDLKTTRGKRSRGVPPCKDVVITILSVKL